MANDWNPEDDAPSDDDAPPVARVVTAQPVRLRLVVGSDERAPAGHVVFSTLAAPQSPVPDDAPMIARGSLPAAMFAAIESARVFAVPVAVLLSAHEAEHGLQGTISALIPTSTLERVTRAMRADDEPWLANAPPTEGGYQDASDEDAQELVPLALGAVVRFSADRRHPDRLDLETVDLLATLLAGKGMDADEKRVEMLLRSL